VDNHYLIFIVGDMPHIVKKFVNALERSGDADKQSTALVFDGQQLTLHALKNIWEDNNALSNNSIRLQHLTADHFPPKNANTRMCVHDRVD
jgi:molybdopterin-guanine dinucleotide biosynthesis protein A